MPDAGYWDARATHYGHTGWSDWVIYRFDQFARLAAVRAALETLDPARNGRAVDYGTGTGDFARMLSRRYEQVVAVDISGKVLEIARKRHAQRRNITFLHTDTERELPTEPVDFVLTVTVLNHIMDDDSLRATMEHLAGILAPGGCFVALESCLVETAPRSSYQRNLSQVEWKAMFERCGLVLENCFGFYHPTADRCRTFERYSRSFLVRLLRRMGPSRATARALGAVAALYLLGRRDYFWRPRSTDALRLMIFRKPATAPSIQSRMS
ncbi:MAG TPA: class I SAM-dependent methyltransferase [Burkholderiales bacterium]|nr:class I SAM-dependent methyltransferase [Burkholderiales bacterium]